MTADSDTVICVFDASQTDGTSGVSKDVGHLVCQYESQLLFVTITEFNQRIAEEDEAVVLVSGFEIHSEQSPAKPAWDHRVPRSTTPVFPWENWNGSFPLGVLWWLARTGHDSPE